MAYLLHKNHAQKSPWCQCFNFINWWLSTKVQDVWWMRVLEQTNIWSCNCMTILCVTNPNFELAQKLSMIYLPHIWSCYQFGLRASPPIFYLSLCWCYHIWHRILIIPPYPPIYLWRELICLFVMLRSPKSWGLLRGFWYHWKALYE
jgi:hypothetical protein